MLDLQNWRTQWNAMDQANLQLLRKMTIEESVSTYLSLCHSLAPLVEESREFFLTERFADMAELQRRLRKFDQWKQRQNEYCAESA